jgi:hypothetical protein
MLRIEENESLDEAVSLRVEGQATGRWVAEIRKACETSLANGRKVVLDLAGVSFANREAIALLLEFRSRGVALVNCSPLLTEQLKRHIL